MNIGNSAWPLWILIAVVGVVFQYWLIVFAIRRAMQDHTLWTYTKWPALKQEIDEGRTGSNGLPID